MLEAATALFAERGYAGTSLENVASKSQVTRGAVYHHFNNKQALLEAVLGEQESQAVEKIMASAMATADPWEAAMNAVEAFLDRCCDPDYGRLVWLEGPIALGWDRFRECEERYFLGLVEQFVRALVDAGYVESTGLESTLRFIFWILGGAGLTLAETEEEDRPRVRNEWAALIRRSLGSLLVK
ncbi:TetR/AcrR family transcriptional regulator [Saccharopolyspora sp. NPDC050389]|uniref:TetR/AcrR family transcriptional regulator n=1 Tax=Saccharopolyspora sp. NPDC050389 TaxID=3155516 RepID=UPI0033CA155D